MPSPARRRPRPIFATCAALVTFLALVLAGCTPPDPDDVDGPTATATDDRPPRLSDFPDASSTGVPDGVRLQPSDSLTIEEDGAVVEGLDIRGTINVRADDVTIRNSRITSSGGPITIRVRGSNLLVEDVEIDGNGRANPVIAFNDYTLRRVHIHNVQEGPRIAGGKVTIEDSFIERLVDLDDNHTDVIQVVSGRDIVIRNNNLQAYNPDVDTFGNAAFMFGEEDGPVRDCLVEGNLINGGNYSINGGGGGQDGAACTFRGNAFQRDTRYGAQANLGPNVVWESSNVWLDSGEPVRSKARGGN